MTKLAWKPWDQGVQLRRDLLSGELSVSQFLADLYGVVIRRGTKVSRDAAEFFAIATRDRDRMSRMLMARKRYVEIGN
jgi:hypothetical protein